jgi:peroxiredoxin
MNPHDNEEHTASANPLNNETPRTAKRGRWLAAAAAAIALALFAVPLLRHSGETGSRAAPDAATCPVSTAANLDFTIKDMNGADVRLADYRGKVILLNYWATWCGPCKVEIPDLVALQDEYRDEGFVVLGVSQDDDPETLREFAKAYKMNYPVLVGKDRPDVVDAQGPVWGLPTTFVIGRDGTICRKHLGPATKEDFEREIKPLL